MTCVQKNKTHRKGKKPTKRLGRGTVQVTSALWLVLQLVKPCAKHEKGPSWYAIIFNLFIHTSFRGHCITVLGLIVWRDWFGGLRRSDHTAASGAKVCRLHWIRASSQQPAVDTLSMESMVTWQCSKLVIWLEAGKAYDTSIVDTSPHCSRGMFNQLGRLLRATLIAVVITCFCRSDRLRRRRRRRHGELNQRQIVQISGRETSDRVQLPVPQIYLWQQGAASISSTVYTVVGWIVPYILKAVSRGRSMSVLIGDYWVCVIMGYIDRWQKTCMRM